MISPHTSEIELYSTFMTEQIVSRWRHYSDITLTASYHPLIGFLEGVACGIPLDKAHDPLAEEIELLLDIAIEQYWILQ